MTSTGGSRSVRVDVAGVSRPVAEQAHAALADVASLATEAVPGCLGVGVSLAIDGEVHTVALTSESARLLDEVQYRDGEGPCLTALRAGEEITCHDYAVDRRWPDLARLARSTGVSSSLSVPLRADDGVIGALNVYAGRPGSFGDGPRGTARTLARHGAVILDQLQQRHAEEGRRAVEHRVVEELRRSLLPELPALPGLASAVRHVADVRADRMGGNWHDLFPLPDGAVGLVIGDAVGHHGTAAATMGQLRSVLRSYAYEGASPSLVLDRMDRLVEGFRLAEQATVFYGRLVVDTGGALLLYGNAGHPPPLLRGPDGAVTRLAGAASGPIGVPPQGHRPRSEAATDLPAGATLLLYTDSLLHGLTEEREVGPGEAIEMVADTLATVPGTATPSALCQGVLDELVEPERHEDVTLLAVRIADRPHSRPAEAGTGGRAGPRPAERARRLAHLLAEAERDSRRLCAELRDTRRQEPVGDDVLSRAQRCHLLVQDALTCGAIELATQLDVPDDQLPS
ncbi:PP2C family protein-serine/threonine phosphatase [Geodermatophilus sp. SYSU D00758]